MSKRKRKHNQESEFDKKILTGLFVFVFMTTFIVEAVDRYFYFKEKKHKN